MPSSGVNLLAMTRVLITGCRALASRLRSPNWPGAATVGRRLLVGLEYRSRVARWVRYGATLARMLLGVISATQLGSGLLGLRKALRDGTVYDLGSMR
jgi:hypothetical protein